MEVLYLKWNELNLSGYFGTLVTLNCKVNGFCYKRRFFVKKMLIYNSDNKYRKLKTIENTILFDCKTCWNLLQVLIWSEKSKISLQILRKLRDNILSN